MLLVFLGGCTALFSAEPPPPGSDAGPDAADDAIDAPDAIAPPATDGPPNRPAIDAGFGPVDATLGTQFEIPDAGDCPPECTDCPGVNTCTKLCDDTVSDCSSGTSCPPGMDCVVLCLTPGSCSGLFVCPADATCTIECTSDTCGSIECSPNDCEIICNSPAGCVP